jgi:hypothetical protein
VAFTVGQYWDAAAAAVPEYNVATSKRTSNAGQRNAARMPPQKTAQFVDIFHFPKRTRHPTGAGIDPGASDSTKYKALQA